MAKGNNNVRNKKPHTSKPYDVSNSFVKKVTSGVTSLLPQTSWISRWFASTSTSAEGAPSTSNEGEECEEEHVGHSPPTKRARIPLNRPFPANSFRVSSPIDRGETHPWPSESITSPIPNVFSDSAVPGPSGLSRTPVASGPFHSAGATTEALEGKINGDGGSDSSESTSGCSSLAPQRATSSGPATAQRTSVDSSKMANHMSSYSLFPSATHKLSSSINPSLSRRRPSFNVSSFGSPNLDSSKLSRESSLNSPFYIGRTMYGGASAYRRPREGGSSENFLSSTRRGGVTVRPANEKTQSGASAEASMSQTARRILEALEQFSSPVSEARRMPLPSQPALSAKRKRPLESPAKSPMVPAAVTNPLTIPMPPERLRLHRLQDSTEAARRIASSVTSASNKYTLRSSDEGNERTGAGKVTKSKPLDEDEQPLPVNLPHISLPITTLPSFDLFSMPVQSSGANSRTDSSKTVSKLAAKGGENSDKVDVEKIKISYSVSSTISSASSTSIVGSSAASSSSGMKHTNFMHVKSSSEISNFKIGSVNDFIAKDIRNNEISSKSANIFNNTANSNPKSVSFSGTDLYHITNSAVNAKGKVEKSNSTHSPGLSISNAVSTFTAKGVPFSTVRADSGNSPMTNDYVFSTPTVLPSSKSKETTESEMKNFDFCKPEVLDCAKYNSKIKRTEPNGFHKLPSNSNVDDVQKSVLLSASCKENSEKLNATYDSGYETKSIGASAGKQNNGWGAKFQQSGTWKCPTCMVRNENEVKVCQSCGGNQSSTTDSKKTDKNCVVKEKDSPMVSSGWGNTFGLQPGMWECSACFVRNKSADDKCLACTTSRPGIEKALVTAAPKVSGGDWGSQFKMSTGKWECSACFVRNDEKDEKCIACTTPRKAEVNNKKNENSVDTSAKTSGDWGEKFKKPSDTWECPVCMISNKNSLLKCAACQEPKPGIDTNRSSTGGSIKFNFEMPTGASNFKFGIDKAEVPQSLTSSSTFTFGGSAKTETSGTPAPTGFVFGVPPSVESKIPAGIKFGVSPPEATASSTAKPVCKEGESKVTSATLSNAPDLSSGARASPKLEVQNVRVLDGVPTSSSNTQTSEGVGQSKKLTNASDSSDSSKKDFKFTVSQASPIVSSADNAEKKGTGVTSLQKPELKTTKDTQPSFNFGTSSVTVSTTASTSTTVTAGTIKASGLMFSSNLPTSGTTTSVATSTAAATVGSVSSSSPSIFSFGSNYPSFKPFVSSAPQTTSSGFFGAASTGQFKSAGDSLFANKSAASTTVPVFGSSSGISPKTIHSAPSFGSTTTAPDTAATPAALTTTSISTFGSPAPVFASPASTTAATVAFGTVVTKPSFANVTSGFGSVTTVAAASTTVSTTNIGSNPSPSFAVPTTTASFGTPVTQSTLSSTNVPTFGSSTTSSGFGVASTTASVSIPTTTHTPSFGAPTPVAFGAAATTGNCFGTPSATQSFNTTTSNVFGSVSAPGFGSSATAPAFGATATPTPSFGNTFGGTTTAAPTFGTASPVVTTTSATTSLPSFGAFSNASKPAQGIFLFGTNSTTTAPNSNFSFNVASQAGAGSGAAAFSFGSGTAPSATNVTTSTTTTPSATATVAPAPGPAFGGFSFTGGASTASPGAPSLFSNAAPAAPVFGAPTAMPSSAPSAPAFGASSATNNNNNNNNVFRPPTFNFGAAASQQPFSFGSNAQSGNAPSHGTSGFSFGQGQPAAQSPSQPHQFNPNMRPTFNFTGGETPQFTASAPASTPQRRVKKAVRRTLR